jgi:hypothetical protein
MPEPLDYGPPQPRKRRSAGTILFEMFIWAFIIFILFIAFLWIENWLNPFPKFR